MRPPNPTSIGAHLAAAWGRGALRFQRLLPRALLVTDGRCCHLDAPHEIFLAILYKKYNERRLNDSTAHD